MMIFIRPSLSNVLYFILFISSPICLLTRADTDSSHHSNETFVEYNSTLSDLTLNTTEFVDESLSTEDNTNASFVLTTIINDSVNDSSISTTIPLETIETTVTTEVLNDDLTTVVTTEKVEETTITTSIAVNVSCQFSKFGCCPNNLTERMGKTLKICLLLFHIQIRCFLFQVLMMKDAMILTMK